MIRTLRELVAPEDVILALPHEHILHNIGSIEASCKLEHDLEIRFEDLIDYRRNPFAHGGRNLLLEKEDEAFRELEKLQQLKYDGLKPLVIDVTLPIEGRDVFIKERLSLASKLRELHIVTVTAFEIERISDALWIGLSRKDAIERIAATLEAELMHGIEKEGVVVFPGAIYQQIQIHCKSDDLSDTERVFIEGLALVQKRTHAPLYLSFSLDETCKKSQEDNEKLKQMMRVWIRTLITAGAENEKIVVCHADRWCHESSYTFLLDLFDFGVSVLFNMVGLLTVSDVMLVNPCYSSRLSSRELLAEEEEEPVSDSCLIKWIVKLLRDKPHYLYQILLSTNVMQRTQYRRYGGGGYTYLFEHFKPRIFAEGITSTQWNQIVNVNITKLLAWYVPPEAPSAPKNYLQCSICRNSFEPVEGEYFTKFAFIYCGSNCLRRHSRKKFAPLPER